MREEALKHASRAQIGIVIGLGSLMWAALNSIKAVRELQGGMQRGNLISVAGQSPKATKKALEDIVETYSEQVN